MTIKFAHKFKAPLILLGLTFLSFLLYNYNKDFYFEQFFFGSQNRILEQNRKEKAAKISGIIQVATRDKVGKYAIYIKDLKTGETFQFHANEIFGTASIYKLAVMYKAYGEIEKGNLKKDDILSARKEALDQILSGRQNSSNKNLAKTTSGELISQDTKKALEDMITISDNYSALLLADRLGWKNIDSFLKAQNIENFDLVGQNSPKATARAIGALLEKIYANTAVNSKYSKEMKTLLFAQKINDRIPKYLPVDIKVGHKTGELESLRHDAGIILGQESDYIFVFLSETPVPEQASENIALLSKQIFDALEEQTKLNSK